MKIKRNNKNVLFENAMLSRDNLQRSDRLGYDYSYLFDDPEDYPYITLFDGSYLSDEILSIYKDGVIKRFFINKRML